MEEHRAGAIQRQLYVFNHLAGTHFEDYKGFGRFAKVSQGFFREWPQGDRPEQANFDAGCPCLGNGGLGNSGGDAVGDDDYVGIFGLQGPD